MRELIGSNELHSFLQLVRPRILTNLGDEISDEESNFNAAEDSPDSHFDSLKGRIRTFQEAFKDDEEVYDALEEASQEIGVAEKRLEQKIEDQPSEEKDEANDQDPFTKTWDVPEQDEKRPIFDDLDE